MNEFEKQDRRKLAAGEIFTLWFLIFRTVNPRRGGGGYFDFQDWGVLQNLRGAIYPRRGGCENIPGADEI